MEVPRRILVHSIKYNSKKTSEKNKENRALKKMQHITGKMSFAQVYEMTKEEGLSNVGIEENDIDDEEKKSQLPPGARDGGLNDIYSQVLGKDKGGRVRMYGYGVTTKDVYGGHSLGQDDIHHIAMEKELEEKNKLIERLLMRNVDLRGQSSNTKAPSTSPNSALAQSTGPSTANTCPLQVGKKVLLKGMVAPIIVAKGFVESLNSAKLVVNGEILGPELCEVKVIVAIVYDEPLLQKVGGVKVVGQAIGRSIAWPKHLIEDAQAKMLSLFFDDKKGKAEAELKKKQVEASLQLTAELAKEEAVELTCFNRLKKMEEELKKTITNVQFTHAGHFAFKNNQKSEYVVIRPIATTAQMGAVERQ
ncbi:hypothetical protein ACS0TY_026763 [Phlomoides rotata]